MVSESNFPQATMEKWIEYADEAIKALDKSDPNYTQHYNNIILEKLSPEYFLIELYGMTADYVNYMMSLGYTNVYIYLEPDGTIADQAIVACGKTIVRTPSNYTTVANVTLATDTTIKFWCQQNGSGSTIQGKNGYMKVTSIEFIKA